jgi:hypothetical protein
VELAYLAILAAPALIQLYSRRIARIALACAGAALLLMGATGFTLQLPQMLIIFSSIILLLDPASDPRVLSLTTLVGVAPLPGNLPLTTLALLLVAALAAKGSHGRAALYALIAIPFTIIFSYLGYTFAAAPLLLMLVGAPPFQRWSTELYARYKSVGVLVALIALINLKEQQAAFAPVAPLMTALGALMMAVGVFKGMKSRGFADLFSTTHQIAFGLLLASASLGALDALFLYLLLPTVLSLAVVLRVHDGLPEKASGLFEFGGLSTTMRVEAASTLVTYLVLFTMLSLGAEVFVGIGLGGDVWFVALGCTALVTAAASLAVFFRSYTLVFEGVSSGVAPTGGLQRVAVAALSGGNALVALVPAWSLGAYSTFGKVSTTTIEPLNVLLMLALIAVALSFAFTLGAKPGKARSWTTGYARVGELQGSRGEVFTSWGEIFRPLYGVRVPDDGAAEALGRVNPLVTLVAIAALVILGVLL